MTLPWSGSYESGVCAFTSKTADVIPTTSSRCRASESSAGLPYTASYPSALAAPVAPIALERAPKPKMSSGEARAARPPSASAAETASAGSRRGGGT